MDSGISDVERVVILTMHVAAHRDVLLLRARIQARGGGNKWMASLSC